jgi:prophage maintenance system killer protein
MLEVVDLVVIASRTLGLDTSQVLGLLDVPAAEHALAQAQPGGGPGDPASLAAALLHGLTRGRPLRRGNQQVALAAMLQFLALNGWEMDAGPPEAVAAVVAGSAAGTLDATALAGWLAPRLQPSGRAAARVKEAAMRARPALPLAERIKKATMRTQRKGMFQRFTDRARRVVVLAQQEARLLRHPYIGPEHILLGLLHEGEGVAARALESLGVNREVVRQQVEQIIGQGQQAPGGHIPLTPRAKKVLELSLREALALGHNYVGTEHLLLALLREDRGVAAQVLTRSGIGHAQVRERVLDLLTSEREQNDPQTQLTAGAARYAILAENQRLRRELERLRDLLRQHGIEPDSGTARPA